MATNEALFSVTGYVATQPRNVDTKSGTKMLTFRIGWTPREISRQTGEWADLPSSFASVTCYKKIAENAACSLRKGDPVVLKGTLRVREYADKSGARRNSIDVTADFLGHDMSKGTSNFTKQAHRAQQTAEEYELSLAAGGDPLTGDIAAGLRADGAGLRADGAEPQAIGPDELIPAAEAVALSDDGDDLEPAAALGWPDGGDPDDTQAAEDAQVAVETWVDADGNVLAEPGELAESPREPAESKPAVRGRSRKPEPVGAGV